jgi:hypothetical protein
MLTELGRKGDAFLTRGLDAATEAAHATVVHARRVVGAVSVALTRVRREAQDLAWDYQDVASDMGRRTDDPKPTARPDERPTLRVVGSN